MTNIGLSLSPVDYFKSLVKRIGADGLYCIDCYFPMHDKEQVEREAQPIGLMKKEHGPDASQLFIIYYSRSFF